MSCQAEQAEQSVQCLLSQPPPIQCGEIAYSSERVFCVETKDWNNAGMCLETCRSFVRSLPARSFHSIFSHSHCVITSVHWTPHELWTDKNWQCRRRRRQEQQYLGGGDLQHERFHPSIRLGSMAATPIDVQFGGQSLARTICQGSNCISASVFIQLGAGNMSWNNVN